MREKNNFNGIRTHHVSYTAEPPGRPAYCVRCLLNFDTNQARLLGFEYLPCTQLLYSTDIVCVAHELRLYRGTARKELVPAIISCVLSSRLCFWMPVYTSFSRSWAHQTGVTQEEDQRRVFVFIFFSSSSFCGACGLNFIPLYREGFDHFSSLLDFFFVLFRSSHKKPSFLSYQIVRKVKIRAGFELTMKYVGVSKIRSDTH